MKKLLLSLVAGLALTTFSFSAMADDKPADAEKKPAKKKGTKKKADEKPADAPAK